MDRECGWSELGLRLGESHAFLFISLPFFVSLPQAAAGERMISLEKHEAKLLLLPKSLPALNIFGKLC